MAKRYLTVVYGINDEEAFAPIEKEIRKAQQSSEGKPFAITAISLCHEIRRVGLLDEAVNDLCDLDLASEIISDMNVGHKEMNDYV